MTGIELLILTILAAAGGKTLKDLHVSSKERGLKREEIGLEREKMAAHNKAMKELYGMKSKEQEKLLESMMGIRAQDRSAAGVEKMVAIKSAESMNQQQIMGRLIEALTRQAGSLPEPSGPANPLAPYSVMGSLRRR
jgi:hypothetical protein